MISIEKKAIRNFLNDLGIPYVWEYQGNGNYVIASVFLPVEQGFYFFTGDNLPDKIRNSLVLLNRLPSSVSDNGNEYIIVDCDVQRLFYQMLNSMFARKSSGKIAASAIIDPEAQIGQNVQIDDFCIVEKCIIGDNSIIGSHSKLHEGTDIGINTFIESHSIIGAQGVAWIWDETETSRIIQPQLGGVKVGENCFLGANTIIVRGSLNENTTVGNHTMMAPGCRIGHGTIIGEYVHFANNIITGGNTRIGDYSFVGSAAVFRPKVMIHANTIIGAGSVVVKNTSAQGLTLMGVPAVEKPTSEAPSGMPKPKTV